MNIGDALYNDTKALFAKWDKNDGGSHYDLYDATVVAEELGAVVEDDNLWLGDMRWGSIQGYVIGRSDEYVRVTYYSYSGDSDGDPEWKIKSVQKKPVTKYEWI